MATSGAEEVPAALRARRPGLRASAVAKARMTPAEGGGQQQRTEEVGLDQDPRPSRAGRAAGGGRSTQHQREEHERRRPSTSADRGGPAAVAGERDEQLSPGEVADQRLRAGANTRPAGDQGDARSQDAEASRGRPPSAEHVGRRRQGLGGAHERGTDRGARTRPTARLIAKIARQSATARTSGTEQRAEHAADLLDRRDHARAGRRDGRRGRGRRPGPASPGTRPPPPTPWRNRPATMAGEVVGQRGDERAQREDAPARASSTGTRPRRSAIRPIRGSIAT